MSLVFTTIRPSKIQAAASWQKKIRHNAAGRADFLKERTQAQMSTMNTACQQLVALVHTPRWKLEFANFAARNP
ncbi:hypothetical protein ACSFA0_22860 [Variovorax sp. LT1P1]|uniref:hypothetical protein n=1 Tax=Variovorax sp. LT1P1 TaxID=3443730 RepID=UPI003F4558D9